MRVSIHRFQLLAILVWAVMVTSLAYVRSQVPEDPHDPNGVAIPYPLLHLVHTTDVSQEGGTSYLRAYDPFLFYQLGRDLVQRQFSAKHGAYGRSGELSVPLYVSAPMENTNPQVNARFARDHASSCGVCHSIPYREPGAGQNIASTSGRGRNTPHFYGAGLIEMLGEQIRRKLLNRYDTNGNGVFDREEVISSCPASIRPTYGAPLIDYGDLQPDRYGVPQLNPVFRVWYQDAQGRIIPEAQGLNDSRVAAFNIAMLPFGWGRGYHTSRDGRKVAQGGEAGTLRGIYTLAADAHMGLQGYDPTQQVVGAAQGRSSASNGGLARVSLNGALQYDFGGSTDIGLAKSKSGISLDDTDGDGHFNELTEGDVDAVEFYMLHSPSPAVRATSESEKGRKVLLQAGCTRCHVENWKIEARDSTRGFTGDRRLFRIVTLSKNDAEGVPQITGALVLRHRRSPLGGVVPLGGPALVTRIYTDFKHWDIGEAFYERRFDGSLQREHRTAPLWGVGSTAPYGHAGQYMSLDEVILRHAGEAAAEKDRYLALSEEKKRLLIEYLESLVLYPTDEIPLDLDGDGLTASNYLVAGQPVGYERFDARFLFMVAPIYEFVRDVKDVAGRSVPLAFIKNPTETYRIELSYRRDSDDDSFPDVVDPLPYQKGVR